MLKLDGGNGSKSLDLGGRRILMVKGPLGYAFSGCHVMLEAWSFLRNWQTPSLFMFF